MHVGGESPSRSRPSTAPRCEIDALCLGGHAHPAVTVGGLLPYWDGAWDTKEGRAVKRFLSDYADACERMADQLAPGGKIVLVVGRRSTGGHRLRLDDFTVDRFATRGLRLECKDERALASKRVPRRVNRFARAKDQAKREHGMVDTMASEIILVIRKAGSPPRNSQAEQHCASADAA